MVYILSYGNYDAGNMQDKKIRKVCKMTKEEIKEKAVEYKHSGYNCAQAVIKALAEAEEMEAEDIDKMLMQTAGFAVGMGTMEVTCGGLIGANMLVGVQTEGKGTMRKSQELYNQFANMCGASICKELKGIDTGVVLCECDDCVRNAVAAFQTVMSKGDK